MAIMNNTGRKHSTPGVYFSEVDMTYASKSLGITTLGVTGETLRGPAFQPMMIENWRQFQTYFGGTSVEKYRGSQYPKYELPYIAKTYLEQSQQLEVVRVLGLSGVNAGPAWVLTATKHKLYTGYSYVEIEKEPEDLPEGYWDDKTFPSDADVPQIPNVTEIDPDYVRVLEGYKWKTDCYYEPTVTFDENETYIDGETLPEPYENGLMRIVNSTRIVDVKVVNPNDAQAYQEYLEEYNLDAETRANILAHGAMVAKLGVPTSDVTYWMVKFDENPATTSSPAATIQMLNDNAEYVQDENSGVITLPAGSEYFLLSFDQIADFPTEFDTLDSSNFCVVTIDSADLDITGSSVTPKYIYYHSEPYYAYYKKVYKVNVQTEEEDTCSNYLNTVIGVLRSRGEHKKAKLLRTPTESDIENGICEDVYEYDGIEYYAKEVKLVPSSTLKLGSSCNPGFSATTGDFSIDANNYGTFTIEVTYAYDDNNEPLVHRYPVTLNKGDKNYIYNVIGGDPEVGESEVYVEELYDVSLEQLIESGEVNAINSELVSYPEVYIVPDLKPVNDLLTMPESSLTKKDLGKRFLYSTNESVVEEEGVVTPITVHYSFDNGNTWVEAEGQTGYIYTVVSHLKTDGKKEYFYGAYVANIEFGYERVSCLDIPKSYEWFKCTESISGAVKNTFGYDDGFDESNFEEFLANYDTTVESPQYMRLVIGGLTTTDEGDDTFMCYKKVITSLVDSTNATYKTEYITPFNYKTDVEAEGTRIFRNTVEVLADRMYYIYLKDDDVYPITLDFNNYKEQYRYASTPWILSEIKGSATDIELNRLFRFHTISDGSDSSVEVKISIENIDPDNGVFDVVVRDFNDNDYNINVLERYGKVNLTPGDPDYIALRIGSFDETYESVSKYITVEVNENDKTRNSIPCGFLGYPVRNYYGLGVYESEMHYKKVAETKVTVDDSYWTEHPEYTKQSEEEIISIEPTYDSPEYLRYPINSTSYVYYEKVDQIRPTQPYFRYNTTVDEDVRIKKQYFGLSDISGIDEDMLKYKGVEAYNGLPDGMTAAFHLDARIFNGKPDPDGYIYDGELKQKVTVDGITGYSWVTVSKNEVTSAGEEPRMGTSETMMGTIYEDKKYRKFTCCFYGGWDGWDYYRTSRSNSDEYRYSKYKGAINKSSGHGTMFNVLSNPEAFGFSGEDRIITSDYYAYLAGVKQFSNPKVIEINVLATPGIDYVNQPALVDEVIEMVEDERADALYVVTTPDKPFGASDNESEMYTPEDAVYNLEDTGIDSNHVCTYYPWEKYFDSANSQYIYLPITRDVCRSIAYTDNIAYPWYAAAGWNRGNLSGVRPRKKLKLGEQDTLYDGRINFINSFANEGDKIWGDKNLQVAESQMNRISKRRLMLRIKKLCENACISLIFDPNDPTAGKTFRTVVSDILDNIKSNRGITDYRIEVDDSPEARERLELNATIYIKPTQLLEYVNISAVILPTGTNFSID